MTQVFRYNENRDTSFISVKHFSDAESDHYPSFSLCLKGDEMNWYYDTLMFDKLWLRREQFVKILQGNVGYIYEYDRNARLYQKVPLDITNISNTNLVQFSTNISDFITKVNFVAKNVELDVSQDGITQSTETPLIYISHQTSDVICFTRDTNRDVGSIRSMDVISLVRPLLMEDGSLNRVHIYDNVEFRIIFHYPGQLLRSYHTPAYNTKLRDYIIDKFLEFNVLQITTFKKRPNSNDPCNPSIHDDDAYFRHEIIKRINCVPIYWRRFEADYNGYENCKSQHDMKQANDYINSYRNVLSSYLPPCLEMKVLATHRTSEDQSDQEMSIKIIYNDDTYQEVNNVLEFGFESFWSSVGGFVGIFLGYSLRQFPELFRILVSMFRQLKHVSRPK